MFWIWFWVSYVVGFIVLEGIAIHTLLFHQCTKTDINYCMWIIFLGLIPVINFVVALAIGVEILLDTLKEFLMKVNEKAYKKHYYNKTIKEVKTETAYKNLKKALIKGNLFKDEKSINDFVESVLLINKLSGQEEVE